MPRVIVIGAGISGLAFAKAYLHLTNYYASSSPPKPVEKFPSPADRSSIPEPFTSSSKATESHDILIVDENPSLGGAWCRSRIYPGLYTQNALGTYEFSDMPLEGEGVADEAGYIAGWKLEEYLVAWSGKWELTGKMRFGVKVNTIYRDPTTSEWILDIIHNPPPESLFPGDQESRRRLKVYCDKLVLAIGTSSEPNKPYIPGQECVGPKAMIHSVELGEWSRENLGIDVDYHQSSSTKPPPQPVLIPEAKIWGSFSKLHEKPFPSTEVVAEELPPTPPPSPTTPCPAAPSLPFTPLKTIAIYGGRKSAFDIVYFFATLPPHLRPVSIHWVFCPSPSTPSRLAASFTHGSFPPLPDWLWDFLPAVSTPIRMDELMAVRLVGLFERCGFESSVVSGGMLGLVRKGRDALGLQGRSWVGKLLQETKLGRGVVDLVWRALDRAWEVAEGIGDGGEVEDLRPGTSGACSTSFLITNQPGFWDVVRQPNIHIHRKGITGITRTIGENGVWGGNSRMQIVLDDGTQVPEVELLVMATGWKTSFPFTFDPPELQAKLGLPYKRNLYDTSPPEAQEEIDKIVKHWKSLESPARQRLKPQDHISELPRDPQNELESQNLTLPLRLFRNMVSPELAAAPEKGRSLLVLGMAKSWQTMIVAEVQALWGAVYLLGGFNGEGREELDLMTLGKNGVEERIAMFEAFSKNTGGGVLLVDSLKYCDILLRDLGLCPWRKSMRGGWGSGWRDWVEVHRPKDYAGIVEEWMERRGGVVGGGVA